MKLLLKILALLIVAVVFIGGLSLLIGISKYRKIINNPLSTSDEIVEFEIAQGETTDSVAQRLKEADIIQSEFYFLLYLKLEKKGHNIQAGKFLIPRDCTMEELVNILGNAQRADVRITIPESLMMIEIAEILAKGFDVYEENSFDKDEFLSLIQVPTKAQDLGIPIPDGKPLEGYLFPDTYRFPADASAEYVLDAILRNFKTKVYETYHPEIEASEFTLYEIINFASILERETRFAVDRPKVADILLRRQLTGWRLEVDATLLYYYKDWKHVITYQDLQLDDPYNTRKVYGLPPTPICNPGIETINAMLNPLPNDYWFYVNDRDGVLHYAVTLYEHNQNIARYIHNQ